MHPRPISPRKVFLPTLPLEWAKTQQWMQRRGRGIIAICLSSKMKLNGLKQKKKTTRTHANGIKYIQGVPKSRGGVTCTVAAAVGPRSMTILKDF